VRGDKENIVMPVCGFPMDIFPDMFKQFIDSTANALHVEPEFVASPALTIMSGAIGNTVVVSPKPGYTVSVPLWLMVIAESGYGKTPVMSMLMRHVERLQAQADNEYRQQIAEYASSADGETSASLEPPTTTHLFVSDCTVESLSNVYDKNGRGVIIHTDEVARLILGLDQYRGKGNDRQHYVELFNGGSWKIDRKSGTKYIKNTGAAIIGGIQPNRLPHIFDDKAFDDGLFPRFLLCRAENKARKFTRKGLDPETLSYWENLLDWCYAIPMEYDNDGFVRPMTLTLSSNALNAWEEYHNEHAERAPFLTVKQRIFMQKLTAYYSLKLAGMLHMIWSFHRNNPQGNVIGIETVQEALSLTDFFAGQVTRVLKLYEGEWLFNEHQRRLIKTLNDLKDTVTRGKLPLSAIKEHLNNRLPDGWKLSSEKIASVLRKLGLHTEKSNHNFSYLTWEPEKIEKLFSTQSITSVTPVTHSSLNHDNEVSKCMFIPANSGSRIRKRLRPVDSDR
jgi:hypothetical protein